MDGAPCSKPDAWTAPAYHRASPRLYPRLMTFRAADERGTVRRRNLRHPARYGALPAGGGANIVADLGSRRALADVGEIGATRRIGELHAVVPAGHVRHVQDLRPPAQVEPAGDVKHVVGSGSYQAPVRR